MKLLDWKQRKLFGAAATEFSSGALSFPKRPFLSCARFTCDIYAKFFSYC